VQGKNFPWRGPRGTRRAAFSPCTDLAKVFRARDGHTLLEIGVALAIVGILAAIGWGYVKGSLVNYRLMQVARMMQADVQQLRTLAISSGRQTRLRFVDCDRDLDPDDVQVGAWDLQLGNRAVGSTEWDTLPPDEDGVVDVGAGERNLAPDQANEAPDVSLAAWPELEGPDVGNEDTVVFSPRGWLENPAGDFTDGFIALSVVNKFALREGYDRRVTLKVSRGGFARLETSENNAVNGTVGAGEATTR
jgi:type II secretory pathway pseudopilin PulG